MRGIALEHAVAHLSLRVLHQEPPLRSLHKDDDGDHDDRHEQQTDDQRGGERALPAEFECADQSRWQLGDNAGENDQRDAVADAARRDLLAEPHQEHGAADQRDDGGDAEEPAGIEHDSASALETDGDAVALQRGKQHRAVARILVDLPAPLLAFLLQLLEMRRDGGEQLDDDRRRDIRHDVEREDRHAPDRAAREHVEHAENAGLVLPEHVGKGLRVDAGDRDIGAEPIDQQRAEREPDALLQLVGLGEGREIEIGDELFCGGDHRGALFS